MFEATNRSSHAIDAYATAKATTTPTAICPVPRFDRSVVAAVEPGGGQGGDRQEERQARRRDAVDPRNNPAEIVAPDRLTPGIEKHWTRPMTSPSRTLTVPLAAFSLLAQELRVSRLGEPHHAAPEDEGHGDHPQASQRPAMTLLSANPTTATGIDPTMTAHASE